MEAHFRKLFLFVFCSVFAAIVPLTTLSRAQAAGSAVAASNPTITDVQVGSVQTIEKVENGKKVQIAKFQLTIAGENLGDKPANVKVILNPKVPAPPIQAKVDAAKTSELQVSAEAPIETHIASIEVTVNAATASSSDFQVDITNPPAPPKVKPFQIKFEHSVDKTFTNLHTVVVTKSSGDGSFASNRNHMHVELSPPGATDLQIVDANEQQMELHFVALADYQPSRVLVTVYDTSNLDTRQAIAVAQPAPATPAADPNQPTISRVDVVFLNRSEGNGRVRIYGAGFAQSPGIGYRRPPYPVDDYLYYCLQREDISSDRSYPPRKLFRRHGCHRLTGNEYDFENPESKWRTWRDDIRKKVNVALNPRNTDLRIERVEIIDISDSYIDVYFEFTRFAGYSMPFRLGGTTVLVQKTDQQKKPPVTGDGAIVTVAVATPKTYQAYQDIGKAPNPNLTYRYTVLDKNVVNTLLGKGIAENFYVLQVAMVNSGTKKVSVPLAAIQAEVEWARGNKEPRSPGNNQHDNVNGNQNQDANNNGQQGLEEPADVEEIVNTSYLEGPPTVTPARLAAVSAHFDAYQKSKGARAIMFNILDGLTTFGAALVPFTGPSLQDAHTVVTGGFIPGLHKAIGDLSSQQLQNLTSLSWQDTESIASGGGAIEKLIYIQRNAQFASQGVTVYGVSKKVEKQITNLLDLDITGYEVNESTGAQATSTSSSQSKPAASTGTSPLPQ